jgi:hypothetical protein
MIQKCNEIIGMIPSFLRKCETGNVTDLETTKIINVRLQNNVEMN